MGIFNFFKPKKKDSENSNLEKKKLEDLIVHANKTIVEISPEAIKISKTFHQKLIDGEINDEIQLNSMIDNYCKSISENELEDRLMDYYKIATFLNGLLSRWGKDGDFKKLNPKGYEELVSINSFINEIGKKLQKLFNDLEKTNINLNQSEKIIFDEFSTSEKEMVYHIALTRAMGEIMMVDGKMDPNEVYVVSRFTEKSENEKNLNISKDNLDITKLKEYKFIWGDPVDLENRENLIISIKNMEESDMTEFFEKLLLLAFSDKDFDPKEQKYIRDLYSSCKEVSKQKSTSWINSKIKEMGLS